MDPETAVRSLLIVRCLVTCAQAMLHLADTVDLVCMSNSHVHSYFCNRIMQWTRRLRYTQLSAALELLAKEAFGTPDRDPAVLQYTSEQLARAVQHACGRCRRVVFLVVNQHNINRRFIPAVGLI
jgi:hypothetical protein